VVGLEFAFLIGGLVVTDSLQSQRHPPALRRGDDARRLYHYQALVMLVATCVSVIISPVDLIYAGLVRGSATAEATAMTRAPRYLSRAAQPGALVRLVVPSPSARSPSSSS